MGGKCRRPTKANRSKKRCNRYRRLRGGFTLSGIAGENSFTLSGRLSGKTLPRGRYRLTGAAGGGSKRAPFEIVGIIRATRRGPSELVRARPLVALDGELEQPVAELAGSRPRPPPRASRRRWSR